MLAGRSTYRIEPAEFVFVNEAAGEEHLLQLSAPDGRSWMAEAPKGESLDEDLLWIFSASSPYELLKQGGGCIGDSEVLLAIPKQWRYKGMPRLSRVDDDGTRQPVQGRPVCRVIGNTASSETLGPVILQYPSQGEAQIRTRMLLLPEQASLEYVGSQANGGEIRFSGWGISTARVIEPPLIQQDCAKSGDVMSLNVTVGSGTRSPEWMTVELLWPHTTSTARIKLPFPATGVRLFDGAGKELQSGQQVTLKDLVGMRLVINRGSMPTTKLALNLESFPSHLYRQFPLQIPPTALVADIALIDYEA